MTEAKRSGLYKKLPFTRGAGKATSLPVQDHKRIVPTRHNLPGSIILVHGVNDVGVAYDAVESGLCEGLTERLCGDLRPATYRMPQTVDRSKLEEDPDAVFYKRQITDDTLSPVIPFYWGFREESAHARDWRKTSHGQATDRYGNRLDRDYSKGGGPFANATTSLPEMWNRGKGNVLGTLDMASRDATHPILKNPGRLYMILAARRLAALISMIRDYDENETVSIVAHSQGCLVSLLAQAFLLDPDMQKYQPGARPADTLILCNPPYSLIDELPITASVADGYSGSDVLMKKNPNSYRSISGGQTLHARLTTLANIVKGVHAKRHQAPALAELTDMEKHVGAVGSKWQAAKDRDNRGKVYLYFSPEDMTVAFAGVEGIGWQGVPDVLRGHRLESRKIGAGPSFQNIAPQPGATFEVPTSVVRRPLSELGSGFFQRVFTLKLRPHFQSGQFVRVGQPPHDFALRVPGEDDHGHTDASDSITSNRFLRERLPLPGDAPGNASSEERDRFGLRRITGEALPKPIIASMGEGALPDAKNRYGASENVDQIDAAISITSDYGINSSRWECVDDPVGIATSVRGRQPLQSPRPALHNGKVARCDEHRGILTGGLNRDKKNEDKCEIKKVYVCLEMSLQPVRPPKLLIERTETPNEARLRWQNTTVPRSFHSAVYGGRGNHRHVTAYDVAIGGGKAPTHPLFYKYLCAVADWRLKKPAPNDSPRPGILTWGEFQAEFAAYWSDERPWRKALVEKTSIYYSTGALPTDLPLPPEGLPPTVVVESMSGNVGKAERVTS